MSVLSRGLKMSAIAGNQPLSLAFLSALAMVLILAVTAISRIYSAQQQALGDRWASRGSADLQAQRFSAAVNDFRTALLYARDDAGSELGLAQSLMGMDRTAEAEAYLTSLWERHPEDGEVNLELARIANSQKDTDRAIRYYHNAIYAAWSADQEGERRRARFELIDLLLRNRAYPQAQSELIALAANLGDDAAQRAHAGDLFLAAQDDEHALAEFRMSLEGNPHDHDALAGAGRAAFALARYPQAARYLREAVETAPGDAASAALLRISDQAVQLNPFREGIAAAQRDRIVIEDFNTAGARLDGCHAMVGSAAAQALQVVRQNWSDLKPDITARGLRENPDQAQAAMSLVFRIERQAAGVCGPPSETDTALGLIANLDEGS